MIQSSLNRWSCICSSRCRSRSSGFNGLIITRTCCYVACLDAVARSSIRDSSRSLNRRLKWFRLRRRNRPPNLKCRPRVPLPRRRVTVVVERRTRWSVSNNFTIWPAEQKQLLGGDENLVLIGEQYEWEPSSLFVIVHRQKRYARREQRGVTSDDPLGQNVIVARSRRRQSPAARPVPVCWCTRWSASITTICRCIGKNASSAVTAHCSRAKRCAPTARSCSSRWCR